LVGQISRESVQQVASGGENADFWPLSKFNTGSLTFRGILLVTRNQKRRSMPDNAYRQDLVSVY